jgi:hypothetical protein
MVERLTRWPRCFRAPWIRVRCERKADAITHDRIEQQYGASGLTATRCRRRMGLYAECLSPSRRPTVETPLFVPGCEVLRNVPSLRRVRPRREP